MIEFKQQLLTYLLCLIFFCSIAALPRLANAADISTQGYSPTVVAPTTENEELRYFRMIGDLLFARPLLLAVTGVGTGMFLVSLPFSALGGNVEEAANTLVIRPAWQTFVRCLGCRISTVDAGQYTQREQTPLAKKEAPQRDSSKIKPSKNIPPKE